MNIYFQDIIERIRIHYKKMTNTERVIADFFLTNTEKMEFTAKAMAARLHVSEPAMTRFSKKIGFSGYREFQYLYEINFQVIQCDKEVLLIPTRIYCFISTGVLPGRFPVFVSLCQMRTGYIFSPLEARHAPRWNSNSVLCGWGFWWSL